MAPGYRGAVTDPFLTYQIELQLRDLDPKTRLRYGQVTSFYQRWLHGKEVSPQSAKKFLAYLRQQGYRPASIALYYTALKLFLNFLHMELHVKLRKPQTLPAIP